MISAQGQCRFIFCIFPRDVGADRALMPHPTSKLFFSVAFIARKARQGASHEEEDKDHAVGFQFQEVTIVTDRAKNPVGEKAAERVEPAFSVTLIVYIVVVNVVVGTADAFVVANRTHLPVHESRTPTTQDSATIDTYS